MFTILHPSSAAGSIWVVIGRQESGTEWEYFEHVFGLTWENTIFLKHPVEMKKVSLLQTTTSVKRFIQQIDPLYREVLYF